MGHTAPDWPSTDEELVAFQVLLGEEAQIAARDTPWTAPAAPGIAGCFVSYATGEAGPGQAGDRAWAAAILWHPSEIDVRPRNLGHQLRGRRILDSARQARDVEAQAVIASRVPAAYVPGLLARREGPILAEAVSALAAAPQVVMVDATGSDHPRRAGLATHIGYVLGIPSVGVTSRPLVGAGQWPLLVRGSMSPLLLNGDVVGYWVCTRSHVRPVVAHAGWRTDARTAAELVHAASSEAARAPIPLQEARRVAREARAQAGRVVASTSNGTPRTDE
jgi:deoxyribonuclease V